MATRRKRSYVPKVRGCYECSQRRIDCDRNLPQCQKCIAKGIHCSGLGIRYRFNSKNTFGFPSSQRDQVESQVWPSDTAQETSGPSWPAQCDIIIEDADQLGHDDNLFTQMMWEDASVPVQTSTGENYALMQKLSSQFLQGSVDESESIVRTGSPSRSSQLRVIESWKEYLIEHFSKSIAPEMAIIDDSNNGWRCLILPIAHTDDLVMDTVLTASAFHLTLSTGGDHFQPSTLYGRAIQSLQRRQDMMQADRRGRQVILAAILVLLATVRVNGYSDFPVLFRLLESALKLFGGEQELLHGDELGDFLRRQILKLRGFAAPLLSQLQGVARLSLEQSSGWEDHWHYQQRYPDQLEAFAVIHDLQSQAGKIYTTRALMEPGSSMLTPLVDKFKTTLESFNSGAWVEHTLVWATFIAACESSTPEHRQFFINALMQHHRRNKFANIPNALQHLEKIWSHQAKGNWTSLLPETKVFIV